MLSSAHVVCSRCTRDTAGQIVWFAESDVFLIEVLQKSHRDSVLVTVTGLMISVSFDCEVTNYPLQGAIRLASQKRAEGLL